MPPYYPPRRVTRILVLFDRQIYSPCEIVQHTRDDLTLRTVCERLVDVEVVDVHGRVDGIEA